MVNHTGRDREHRGRSRSRSRERDRDDRKGTGGKERERSRSRDRRRRDSGSRSPPPARRSASPPPRRRHRSTSHSPSRHHHHKRRRSKSRSRSRSRSGSPSSGSDGHRRHKKGDKGKDRHREKKRRHSGSRSRSRSRSRDRERKERKREKKKEKKEKKKYGAVTSQWGKYGILTEADMYNKEQEFHLWLLEERHQNIETLSKPSQKKLFLAYMEDFNTATLPHEKYYALEPYERRMALVRSGGTLPIDDGYDPNKDFEQHKSTTKRIVNDEPETYLSREQLVELRRVQLERTQVGKMKQMGLEVKGSMGVRMDGNQFE